MIPTTKSIESVAPVIILGLALGVMLFTPIPVPNKDLINLILAGFLGYLSRSRTEPPATTITTGEPPDQTTVTTGEGS